MTRREKILQAKDIKLHPVHVPEWDETVYLRTLSATERNRAFAVKGDQEKLERYLAITAIRDEDGTPLFEESDADALMAHDGSVIERLTSMVINSNFPDVDALEKNSRPSRNGSSSSGSPSILDPPSPSLATA